MERQSQILTELFNKGIYVIHALKGYEYHEKRIIELFGKMNMSFEFVTDGDPQNFDKIILQDYFVNDIKSKLSEGVLSCTLNHIYAFQNIVDDSLPYGLIFENDPFFLGDFKPKLSKVINEMVDLKPGFIISLENTSFRQPSVWDTQKGKHLYQATNCRHTAAYIIDNAAARAILEEIKTNKCTNVIDWWQDELIAKKVVKMYWAFPSLVEEGSHNGQMCSTISTKKSSLFRRISWFLQKQMKMSVSRLFPNKYIVRTS